MKSFFAEQAPSRLVVRVALLLAAGLPTVKQCAKANADGSPLGVQQTGELSAEERQQQRIMERFLTVLENRPRRGTALERVYGYHVEQGTLDALVKRYEDRVEADEADGTAWMLLGLIHSQRGQDAAAVEAFRKAEEHLAEDPLPCYYLGQSLVLVGQPDEAAEAFERALARNPERADLLQIFQALGRLYSRAHRTEEALAVWQRLEARFPEDLRVQEEIARALAEEQQLEPALERFARLSERVEDEYRQVFFRMEAADLKVRLGRTPEALADFEALLGRLNPDSWLYREVRRNVEEVFLRSDDLAGLAEYYERWIEKTPDDVDAMVRLARTLALEGRAPEAQQWYDKAVQLAPSREELRLALIEQFVFDGKIKEAIAQYEQLDKVDRNNPDYVRDWGLLILQDTDRPEAQRKQAAAAVWRRLTAAHPDDPVVATQVADLFRQAEMTDEAIALYQKAVELAPENAQYLEYLGEYYHSLKRSEEALATWQKIAAGPGRTAASLERLAEVTAGFGYLDQALEAIDEAARLDSKNFSLGLHYADLLHRAARFDDALARLAILTTLAENEEEREAVLEHQIENYRAGAKLDERIAALSEELEAGKEATADRWKRLARYLEAARRTPEATAAIQKSLELAGESTPVLLAAARIYENSGNLLAAAEAYRKLAKMDRRFRTEHLTNVAKLEARLGRRDAALEAGRDLLAAAPGNPEHYEFFAQLCFQLGEDEQGFDALRRAVRVNASDPQALLTLAAALGDRFRTDEAIELYWQAFEKAADLDGKVAVVARLADLYLQTNHFDRLLEHLERERRGSQQQREMTICLAHAHKAAGDFGTARQELERLLSINTRDTQLLGQLAALAESEGDVTAAADYQRQLAEIAPSNEGKRRLAELYDRAGLADEAETIWVELSRREDEPHRILESLDSLARHGKQEAVLSMSERLLRKDPRDWEVLYRNAVALFETEKLEESASRFQEILDLRLDEDEEGAIAKARKNSSGRAAGYRVNNATAPESFPLQQRIYSAYEIRRATGLDPRYYNYSTGPQARWSPSDFGQARMAAIAWLLRIAEQKNEQEAFIERLRKARDSAGADGQPQWDWYYLQLVRQDQREAYEAAKALSQSQGGQAQWAYLVALPSRTAAQEGVVRRSGPGVVDNTPPLSDDELDHMLACYDAVRRQQPEWVQSVVAGVVTELKRAKRSEDEERIFRESVAAANQPGAIYSALSLAVNRKDTEAAVELFDRLRELSSGRSRLGASYMQSAGRLLGQAMWQQAEAKDHEAILRLLDHYLSAARAESRNAAAARQNNFGNPYGNRQPYYYVWRAQNSTRSVQLDYPAPNAYYDYNSILLLRNAYEYYQRDDLLSDLVAHFREQLETCPLQERTYHHLALSYLHWWNEEKDEAVAEMTRAVECARDAAAGLAGSAPADDLQLELAELRERRGELDEALALVDQVRPLDHRAMQRRETAALRLAVQTGNVDRARQAAERLFGLRLDSELQVQLAAQMHQLGMHELAEAVMARARRRAGNQVSALVSLMLQYQAQGKMETATQVAHQILRRTPVGSSTPFRTSNDAAREQAIQVLARSGKLQDMIARAEAQLERSPHAIQIQQTLGDFYRASGDREKAAAAYERIAELRPDDARLRYQTAEQLAAAGEAAKAVEHYTKAIKQEPALFRYNYWNVQRTYQQANKLDDLVKLLGEVDVRSLGSYYVAGDIMQTLMRDPKTREQGLALFRRFWEAFPNNRANMITNIYDDEIWRLPEMYEYLRAAVVPSESQSQVEQWSPVDYIYSWSSDGTVTGVVTRLMIAVERQNQFAALSADVEGALERFPQWSAGKALQAVLLTRQGKTEGAKELLEAMLNDENNPIPLNARWVIGQQLENYEPLQGLVLRMYEEGLKDALAEGNQNFSYSPAKRLVGLYRRNGQKERARELVLEFAHRSATPSYSDPRYEARQRIEELNSAGEQLVQLGYPADAVRLYGEVLRDTQRLQLAESAYGGNNYLTSRAEQGLNRALEALTPETLASTVGLLLKPEPTPEADAPAVQLMLLVNPTQLDRAKVTSLLSRAIQEAASNEQSVAALESTLDALVEQHPADMSVQVAAGLAALAGKDEARIEQATTRLVEQVAQQPLEALPEGARANARQRADAAKQIGLWLVARECWRRESLREVGDRLAERALAAARRQNNAIYTLAMLREWGEQALEAGDRQRAEEFWSQMLELLTSDPLGQTSSGGGTVGQVRFRAATAPPVGAAGAARAAPAAAPRRASPARAKPASGNAATKTSGPREPKPSEPEETDDKKPPTKGDKEPAKDQKQAKPRARDAPERSGGSTASPRARKSDQAAAMPQSVPVPEGWYPCRLSVKGGTMTACLNGRKVHEERLAEQPDTVAVEAEHRRGPSEMPLKAQAWNHVKLALEGDVLSLHLNDELIYERKREPHNRRVFGLFHYADETEVRVRNVTSRGDGPRALPTEVEGAAAVVGRAPWLGVPTLAVRAARIASRSSQAQREAAAPPAASGSRAGTPVSGTIRAQEQKSRKFSGAEARVPVVTVDRFDQIMQLAKLAASKGMHELSLRAVRAGLRGGPPVKAMQAGQGAFGTLQRSGVMIQGLSGGFQGQGPSGGVDTQIVRNVEQNLFDLDGLWTQHHAPAETVYEALAGAVLPKARASEIFLYPRPLVYGGVESPRSTGELLVRRATRAARADELRRAVEARQAQPMAAVPARVLLAQLGLALGDDALTDEALAWLEERLQKDTLQYTAELACHAALPALGAQAADADEVRQRALAVVEQAVKNLVGQSNEEPLASLHVALARYHFAASAADEARRHLDEYLAVTERNNARYSGDYGLYRRTQQLQKVVFELARAGQLSAALEMLGRLADVPISSNRQEPALAGVLGPITRMLEGLTPQQRYELLRDWTLPTDGRNSVRLLARYLPRDSAPEVFLTAGRKATAPRSAADPLQAGTTRSAVLSGAGEAEAIHQPGLFNSLDVLTRAASAAGKLDELALEVRKAVEAKAQDAELLDDLLSIARGRGAELAPKLGERLKELEQSRPAEGRASGRLIEWQDYVIARACLAEPALAGMGREFARGLLVAEPLVQNWDDYSKITHLRNDIATSYLHGAKGGRLAAKYGPRLRLWEPSAIVPTGNHQQGVVPHWWIEHDGHVRHVVGPEFDYLFFKYPLAGEFEFSFDGYFGPHSGPGLTYGGLHFEAGGQKGQTANMISVGIHDRQVRATPFLRWEAFNRISVQVRPDKVRYLLNNHVYYEDNDPAPVSPWLALYTWRTSGPVHRNLRIIGSPTIPREVPLTFEDRLDGWSAGFYGGYSQPPRLVNSSRNYPPPDQYQWSSREGVIHGRRDERGTVDAQQDVLLYHRPMGDGETLRYEFYYVPGEYEVHPALGRLTFLLEPQGVRLHWMTDGPDDLWYGLPPDNAVDEPENRHGPTPIPLKTDDWNAVVLSLDEGRVHLELNGELVYERPLEPGNGRLFGLFHYRDRSAVQVCNVVLRGDWPEQIPEALRANLLARADDFRPTAAELRVSHAIMGEKSFAKAVDGVLRTAQGMTAEQRYDFLRDWVLPNERHPTVRAYGTFLPGDGGGTLEAPAAQLVATAKELGRLDELLTSVRSAKLESKDDTRAQLAIMMLIQLARGDTAEALAALEQLRPLSQAVAADAPRWQRWPELLAQWHAVGVPALHASGQALADVVTAQMSRAREDSIQLEGRPEWTRELLHCRARLLATRQELQAPRHWSPVVHATAASHGGGAPPAHWTYRADGTMLHWAGHGKDFLYFAVPLRGEFEITCELKGFGPNQMNLAYGGGFLHMPDATHLDWTDYGGSARQVTLDPPLEVEGFYPFRLVVNKGTLTVYANGHRIDEQPLGPEPDPWLALYQTATGQGGVRNLKVVGSPEIPEQLRLSKSPELTGWLSYYEEPMSGENAAWAKRGEEIFGRLLEDSPGSKTESLLVYHRPLLEDGELQYEFYYDPDRAMTHPALDRLVLLLEPEGVKLHRLTDGAYERTGLAPDNVTAETEVARGPAELPLKANEWNHVKLVVAGDTIRVYLNGELVCQRSLEPHNRRTFGLFHYADETEARVRNVTYQGDWPRELSTNVWQMP